MTKTEFIEQLTTLRNMIQGTLDLAAKEGVPVEPPVEGLPAVTLPDLGDPEDQFDIVYQIERAVNDLYNAVTGVRHERGE